MVVALVAGSATLVTGTAASTPVATAALADQVVDPVGRPLGALTVIGDSVLQGSLTSAPTVVDQLAARGWGPIRARAGVGYSTGHFPASTEAEATFWIDRWRAEGWDAPDVFVNLGANDSGRCDRDLACARDAIMHLVDRIGPGHRIWWPKVTRHPAFQHQADTWNQALDEIAAERDDLITWDWPAALAGGGFRSGDNTHLDTAGYRARSELLARFLTADLADGSRTGGDAPLPTAAGDDSELVPLEPIRLLDTRVDPPGRVGPRGVVEIDVTDHVPDGTTAVVIHVSTTLVDAPGFVTAYTCGSNRPEVSTANHLAGETRGAVTVVPVSGDGTVCVYTLAEADVLVDLQAAFVPAGTDGALRLDPLSSPRRLLDTRDSGRSQVVEVAAPDGADAISVSVTAVDGDDHGFVVAYPCSSEVPLVSTLDHGPDEVISGTAYVPVGPDGTVCFWSLTPVDLTVDLTGTFADVAALVFRAATPTRMLDTRSGIGGWSPVHGLGQRFDVRVAPPAARAVTGTLTIVGPLRPAFLRAWGCGAEPDTANVTAVADAVLANSVTTAVDDDGRLCIWARDTTNTVFDTTGWWLPGS